jgi:acyl-CoA oxidase
MMPHLAALFAASSGILLLGSLMEKNKAVIAETPDGPEAAEVHAIMSICKPLCAWYSQRGLQECRELMAGHGYSSFSGIPTLMSDNDVNNTWEGENNVLLQQTARYIFKNLQRIIKGQAIESEFVSFLTINGSHSEPKAEFTSKEQLRDNIPLLKKMMEHRTQLLVRKSMTRLQENGGKFHNMFETWNHTQAFFMHSLSISFGEMVLTGELSKMAEVAKAQCTDTGAILTRLLELFVASKVVADLGTFREGDYISSDQGNMIRDWMMDLCNEVAESSIRLIDAVALPDKLLGSAFGVADGRMYRAYADMVEGAEACYQAPSWVSLLKETRKAL